MTRIARWLVLACIATPYATSRASAQASDTMPKINMEIGTPVRVVARDTTQMIVGTFARQLADTFVVHRSAGANDTTLFLRNLLHIDEQAHPFNTPATRQGAIIGGVVGLAAGILILREVSRDCDRTLKLAVDGQSTCDFTYAFLPNFVAAGAGLGFGIAWVSERPRWQLRWSAPLP